MEDLNNILVNSEGIAFETWPTEPTESYSVANFTILHPELIWVPEANRFLPKPPPPAGFFAVAGLVHVYSQGKWQVAFNSFRNDLESASFKQEILTREGKIETQEDFDRMKAGRPPMEEHGREVTISVTYPPRKI